MLGSQMNLKNIADKKKNAAVVQDAILETAEEQGIDSAKLAKQKIAKFGGKFTSAPIAKDGINQSARPFDVRNFLPKGTVPAQRVVNPPFLAHYDEWDPEVGAYVGSEQGITEKKLQEEVSSKPAIQANIFNTAKKEDDSTSNGFPWESILQMGLTSASPLLRSKYDKEIGPEQLAPEMLGLALNQLEPVQAQLYNPMLTQATSISLQDQLNEVTAQTRAAERFAQGDPSALAMIAAQGQQAKSKILGEQFRMNQAEKQRVAEQNAAVLNDAQLKNLALLDQQYVRQSQAKSNTKQQAIEVAKSIADKIAKKKSENLTANLYKNMYPDFNITSSGAAYKNPYSVASFGPGMSKGIGQSDQLAQGYEDLYNKAGQRVSTRKTGKSDETVRNGAIVKAIKNL
jgi:hypothetical protein